MTAVDNNIELCENGEQKSRPRMVELDMLRGIAMVLVIADHCRIQLTSVFDYFEVPAFFVVAGFLINTRRSFGSFVLSKSLRLLVPYIFYGLLFILVSIPLRGLVIPTYEEFMIGLSPGLNYPLWFLKALYWSSLAAYMVLAVNALCRIKGGVILSLFLSVAAAVFLYRLWPPMWMKIYGFIQGFQAVPMLLFGAVLHELISRFDLMSILENKKIRYVVALSGLVILIAASFIWDGHIELHRGRLGDKYVYYPYAMLVFIGYFAIVAGLSHLRWLSLPVGYIGRWSLFIFCTHAMVLEYVERYLSEPAEVFAVTLSISVILAFAASKSTLLKKLYLF